MNLIQGTLQLIEVGKGQVLIRLVPLITALAIIGFGADLAIYHGLDDAQSMDNAQLARQIVRGQGFTTGFLRPHAIAQLRDYAVSQSLQGGKPRDLFPAEQFPPGTPRILPDTYNAPGYPYLLAGWFYFIHPEFDEPWSEIQSSHHYTPERWIPPFNQIFLVLTAILVFALGRRLFDQRVAWVSIVIFLATDLIWKYTMTALSTTVAMFLVTAVMLCVLEIFCVGEASFDSEERSFKAAWFWGIGAALLLGAACLTRLHLLALLVPIVVFLLVMPRASVLLSAFIVIIVAVLVAPWYIHLNNVSGNPLGSNAPLMLYGVGEYQGNQIYCTTAIPSYEQLFKDASHKEYTGLRWHFEHAWSLLGCNPLVLLFGASILHQFKRRRTRLFHWLVFACIFALVLVNNLGSANPDDLGPWNVVILLFPCMVVLGGAFFFILLDRLALQLWLLNNLIVTTLITITIAPLILTLTTTSNFYYAFPPYVPPVIKQFAQFVQPDEWVTSDMPWATAWYGDRASLWLPDSLSDFESFHDNVCPTGLLMFTPVTWASQISSITSGEYKDWLPFMLGAAPPANFPLGVHSATPPGGPDYSVWSDRPRWQTK